jgi:hypothetical protein
VEPEFGPPVPPRVRPLLADLRLPGWATTDWPLVGLGVALMLVLLFGLSALVGLVASAAVAGDAEAAPCGAAVGAHLAFAAFGARTFAGCGGEHGSALAIAFLPLPWALVGGAAVEAARRFAWRRLPDERPRRVAYAGKLALASGVALGIIAGLVARGDPVRRGSGFASSLNGGEVWFYTSILTWFWAWLGLRRQGLRVFSGTLAERAGNDGDGRPGQVRRFGRRAAEGAGAFAVLTAGLAVLGLAFALVVADSGHERIGVLFGFPVVGFSVGAALADAAMGAALGGLATHTSLVHFGLPAGRAAAAAPVWLFAVLLLAPALVAATVWRRLERDRPGEEQAALAIGAATGLGFALAAWLAALVGRIVLLATVTFRGGWFGYSPQSTAAEIPPFNTEGTIGSFLALRPNPAAVLSLALLWGLAGGLGAAFVWASRHNARWQIAGEPVPPAENAWLLPETPPTPVPPPGPPTGRDQPGGEGAAESPEEKP